MSVAVRVVRPEEWRMWRETRLRALADAPDAFGETLEEARGYDDAAWQAWTADRPDALRLVAERAGRPVGMMVVVIDAEDQRVANVYAMWVGPEARGGGVGGELVRTGLAWARARGALEVRLRVAAGQVAARRLYAATGFVPNGERSELRPGCGIACEGWVRRLPPLVMGVVNVTADSFSDGGAYLDPGAAIAQGLRLWAEGADIVDVGGEATNPRARPVAAEDECRRVLPVIEALVAAGATVSIDTTKAEVARQAIAAGATIVNDVSGGLFDPAMVSAIAGRDVTYIASHLRGRSLAEVFAAEGTVSWHEVAAELGQRVAALPATSRVWVDPGIGFGKGAEPEGNVALVRHAGDIGATLRRSVVVGVSRKRFLRRLLGLGPDAATLDVLDAASVLASVAAVRAGAHVVRVHNVALLRTALTAYNNE